MQPLPRTTESREPLSAPEAPSLASEVMRQWRLGAPPRIEDLLCGRPSTLPDDLATAVRIDLRQRWQHGECPTAGEYLARFPALAADAELAVDVIYAEYLAREARGEQLDVDEFAARHSDFATALSCQIHLHRAIDDQATDNGHFQESSDTVGNSASADAGNEEVDSPLDAEYEILEELGRGGMGVVYRARQVGLNRLVALKMARFADGKNHALLARFRAEAETIASLHHSQIVQVYDYGEFDGLPFLALELVEGGTLADRLRGVPWGERQAAALVADLARTVHFAHGRGVVHRDLKPANVLIADAQADDKLEVKIADFGLAKVFRDTPWANTQTGALLGTPSYMAPEQASGQVRRIGPATDIYALGAILYELLTGRPPFLGETPMETLHQLLSNEPVSVARLAPRVSRDLSTTCAKCLNREPQHRYASAGELADDLDRFLADQPILARRTGNVERVWRWCRRNRALATALGSIAALLVLVAAVAITYSGRLALQLAQILEAQRAEQLANQSAQVRLWDAYLAASSARNASRQIGQRFLALEAIDQAHSLLDEIGRTDDRVEQLRNAAIASLTLPDVRHTHTITSDVVDITQAAVSAVAGMCVLASRTGQLVAYDLADGRALWRIEYEGESAVPHVAPGGRFVAATGSAGVRVWRIDEPEPVLVWHSPQDQVLSFAPDGVHAAISDAAEMRLVEVESGTTVRRLGRGEARSRFEFHESSSRVAVVGADGILVIDVATGNVLLTLPEPTTPAACLAWHPSGRILAAWGYQDGIVLWDASTGQKALVCRHRSYPWQLRFSADGASLMSYSVWDHRLMLWDVGTGQRVFDTHGFQEFIADTCPHGDFLLVQPTMDAAAVWHLATGVECRTLDNVTAPAMGTVNQVCVSPDNRLISVTYDQGFALWDLKTFDLLATWRSGIFSGQFAENGDLILANRSRVSRWPRRLEVPTPASPNDPADVVVRFGPPALLADRVIPSSVAVNRAGGQLVFERVDRTWKLLQLRGEPTEVTLRPEPDARRVAISDDGRLVAIANWETTGASVWDGASGEHLADLPIGHTGDVAFSPDGRFLAATPDGVTIWRTDHWQQVCQLHARGSTPTGLRIAFSPDCRVLAVSQPDGLVRLVDPATGRNWAQLTHPDAIGPCVVTFSPDQTRFATLPLDGQTAARAWNITALRRGLASRGLDWPTDVLAASTAPEAADTISVEFDFGDSVPDVLPQTKRWSTPDAEP